MFARFLLFSRRGLNRCDAIDAQESRHNACSESNASNEKSVHRWASVKAICRLHGINKSALFRQICIKMMMMYEMYRYNSSRSMRTYLFRAVQNHVMHHTYTHTFNTRMYNLFALSLPSSIVSFLAFGWLLGCIFRQEPRESQQVYQHTYAQRIFAH